MQIRKFVARLMRKWADRIDWYGAAKATGWSFTYESGKGIEFNQERRGCPLWYLGNDDYERAHTESLTNG